MVDCAKCHAIAREMLGTHDDDFVGYVLWNETGYPHFFSPRKGESHYDELRRQLKEYISHGSIRARIALVLRRWVNGFYSREREWVQS